MWYINQINIITKDLLSSPFRIIITLIWIVAGFFYVIEPGDTRSLFDITNTLYSSKSFCFIIVPTFFIIISVALNHLQDINRIIRYETRQKVANYLILNVIWIAIVYAIMYEILAFSFSYLMADNLHNLWITNEGTPYKEFQSSVHYSWYNTNVMVLRYFFQESLVLICIGIFLFLIRMLTNNMIIAFIITFMLPVIDADFIVLHNVSFLNRWLSLSLYQLGGIKKFLEVCCTLGGITLLEITLLLLLIKNYKFFNSLGAE